MRCVVDIFAASGLRSAQAAWLGCLEPAHRHMYLLDDQGIGRPRQGAQRVGYWGLQCMVDGGMMTSMVITCKTLSSTFLAMDTMALWAAVGTLCTDSSLYSIACPVPSPVSLLVRLVITEVS